MQSSEAALEGKDVKKVVGARPPGEHRREVEDGALRVRARPDIGMRGRLGIRGVPKVGNITVSSKGEARPRKRDIGFRIVNHHKRQIL